MSDNIQKNAPTPLFDSLNFLQSSLNILQLPKNYHLNDIKKSVTFLQAYQGSQGTFNAYRREVERLLHWCALVEKKSLKQLKRVDIENFLNFCKSPPRDWIGTQKYPRFYVKNGLRQPNSKWRPFVVTLSKAAYRKGQTPNVANFILSETALRELLAILSSFYSYLQQEEYVEVNPVSLIRQKSKFVRRHQTIRPIRRLSELQWNYVIETAEHLAQQNASKHERTLFVMSILYAMYLRISELAASSRWVPQMNHFFKDQHGNWWFVTVGKGNKERQIAVSDAMLNALKRWRSYLNLTLTPSPADQTPLLPKTRGKGPIKSINYLRRIVQYCFDRAIERLIADGFTEEAESLTEATVHWLRHTGISDDVKRRPREHVRDDAGHSSSAITDRYIDIELVERHQSAKDKPIETE
jgi:site-specific recombinase XerD